MANTANQIAALKALNRQRYQELKPQRDAIRAASAPLRAQLDGKTDEMTGAQERALRAQIVAAEQGLGAIDLEMGQLAVSLMDADGKIRLGAG